MYKIIVIGKRKLQLQIYIFSFSIFSDKSTYMVIVLTMTNIDIPIGRVKISSKNVSRAYAITRGHCVQLLSLIR